MKRTVVRVVRIFSFGFFCAAQGACIDPLSDYNDFRSRASTQPSNDAGVVDVELTGCAALLATSPSGTFFGTCLPIITGQPFGLAVQQEITGVEAGAPEIQIAFTLLKIDGTNVADTVGAMTTVPKAPIASDCTYHLEVGDLTIPAEATTLQAEAKAQGVSLNGLLETEDSSCAELDGKVTSPVPLPLDGPGDYCVFRRVPASGVLPAVDMSEYACPLPAGDP
jgi:hypothetical protein